MRSLKYLPTLTGWRALSVIAIVLYHGRVRFFGEDSWLTRLALRGHAGVDVFFAISGFLICRLLLEEQQVTGQIHLGRFYVRRGFRILPAYYAVLVAICALEAGGALERHLMNLPSCLFFYRNFMPLSPDVYGDFYTAHFWTLAVEEQFYLLWPVLLLGLRVIRCTRLALGAAVLSLFTKLLLGYYPALNGAMPVGMRLMLEADTILWGCLAAIYLPELRRFVEKLRFSQIWLPISVALLVTQATHSPGLLALSSLLLPALVLSTVLEPLSWLSRLLEWRPLLWIGSLSYSMYLWQELFLPPPGLTAAHPFLRLLQQPPWSVLAIIACACGSRYLVEIPALALGRRLLAENAPQRQGAGEENNRFPGLLAG